MGVLATRRSLLKLGLLLLPVPFGASAQPQTLGVVELFTSQGCSSCPPADALFAELAARDDLVTLAYHVDYWDYLGWKDELATAENTERQRAYGEVFDSTVYTPQVVVNGRTNVVGSDRSKILAALEQQDGRRGLTVDLSLATAGENFIVEIGRGENGAGDAHIVLVHYNPKNVIEIRAGENAGRTIDYRNIVTSFQTVGVWNGEAMRLELPKSPKKGGHCAVLLQKVDEAGRPGPILGAVRSTGVW